MFDLKDIDIQACLPHRYPLLMVDRVLEFEPYKRIKALKNISFNEQWAVGHFPGNPIFPGVLLVEALAQSACILGLRSLEIDAAGALVMLVGIDKTRFMGVVRAGDQLELFVKVASIKGQVWKFDCHACVNEKKVCKSVIMCYGIENK